jgi:hypothetical protein
LAFATPAAAGPCDDNGMSSVEYAIEEIVPDAAVFPPDVPGFSPGSSCSTNDECKDGEKCEGGSCCVQSGQSCSGVGYCCGHPSQGCVNGQCP